MARKKKVVSDTDLIARFIKRNGVTECPFGQRRHSERQYLRSEFGEVDLRRSGGRVHGAIDPTEVVVEIKYKGRVHRRNAFGEWMA